MRRLTCEARDGCERECGCGWGCGWQRRGGVWAQVTVLAGVLAACGWC